MQSSIKVTHLQEVLLYNSFINFPSVMFRCVSSQGLVHGWLKLIDGFSKQGRDIPVSASSLTQRNCLALEEFTVKMINLCPTSKVGIKRRQNQFKFVSAETSCLYVAILAGVSTLKKVIGTSEGSLKEAWFEVAYRKSSVCKTWLTGVSPQANCLISDVFCR